MDTSPSSRRRVWILAGLLFVSIVVGALVVASQSGDDLFRDAYERSSAEAPVSDCCPLPVVESAPRPSAPEPSIELGPILELALPVAAVDPPGGGPILVASLDGLVHAVDLNSGASEVALDLSDEVTMGVEQGLLGMASDGDRLYLSYSGDGGDNVVRSWPMRQGRPVGGPADGVLHLEIGQPFDTHNGGHLAFGPDGVLWVGTGDGGAREDPGEVGQDPDALLAKMLRVVPVPAGGYEVASGNPEWRGRAEVWAIGLRNPWRYSFDRHTNRLWIADVGQNDVEEVSVVDPRAPLPNFGWDEVEGDLPHEGTDDPSFIDPVVTYGHDEDGGCAVIGGYVYRGDVIASLYGWYLYSDLCSGWIRAVPADDPTRRPVELMPSGSGHQVTSFAELEDGELLLLSAGGINRILER